MVNKQKALCKGLIILMHYGEYRDGTDTRFYTKAGST